MAASFSKNEQKKEEIQACSKLLAMESAILDQNLVIKALFRRGTAYEKIEKYKEAKEDMMRVKTLQPSNIEASKCLTSISKALASLNNEERTDKIYKNKDDGT